MVDDHTSSSLNVLSSGDIIFSYESMMEPSAVYYAASNGTLTQMTFFNSE